VRESSEAVERRDDPHGQHTSPQFEAVSKVCQGLQGRTGALSGLRPGLSSE
jgi:hypothetical protein